MRPDTGPRKQPKQQRSREMRERILDASLRVLNEEGALRFTTSRVADEAGISVGSLYQYFPNKHAIVAALHDDDIEQGWATANEILDHPTWTGERKLVELARWYFETEADEARRFGAATGDIELFLHEQAGGRRNPELMAMVEERAASFVARHSSHRRTALERREDATYLVASMQSIAKAAAARAMSDAEIRRWADRTAKMLADHLGLATAVQ